MKSSRMYTCKVPQDLGIHCWEYRFNTDWGDAVVKVVVRDWRYYLGESTERGENMLWEMLCWGSKRKKIRTQNKEEKGPESRREPG